MGLSAKSILKNRLTGSTITLLDVGAKGGVLKLPKLSPWIQSVGFEPNPHEFENVKDRSNVRYLPIGLSEHGGEMELRITNHSSYSSFLEFDQNNFRKHFHRMRGYSVWEKGMQTQKKIAIQTQKLDQVIVGEGIDFVDLIKLDTQGTELEILKGGINALKNKQVGIIFAEVSFVRSYKGQNLFSDLDLFLRKHHFEFLDCKYYPDISAQIGLNFGKTFEDSRYSVGGDAVFVPDLDLVTLNEMQRFKIGVVLASLGYYGMSYNFLGKSHLKSVEVEALIKYFRAANYRTFIKKFIPPIISYYAKKLMP